MTKSKYYYEKDRNKCTGGCKWVHKRDNSNGVEWDECNRCGERKNLSHPV